MNKLSFLMVAAIMFSLKASADVLVVEKTNGEKIEFDVSNIKDVRFSLGEVESGTSGGTWSGGEDSDINSTIDEPEYGTVKVGDYYYSDGSWSDGGFISYDNSGHGSIKWATPKPAPSYINPVSGKERKLIGIVYSTDTDRMGDAEKAALASIGVAPHGMVMALKHVATTQWDSENHDESTIGLPNVAGTPTDPLYAYANAEISGYKTHTTIIAKRTADVENMKYHAIADALTTSAPAKSTGWYVPATGQWFDILRNLTGLDFSDKCDFYFTSDYTYENDGLHFDWQLDRTLTLQDKYSEKYDEIINATMSEIPESEKDLFSKNCTYATSTSASATQQYLIFMMAGKYVSCKAIKKDNWESMRPVLAF